MSAEVVFMLPSQLRSKQFLLWVGKAATRQGRCVGRLDVHKKLRGGGGGPSQRFIIQQWLGSLHGFLTAHWDHKRTRIPLTRPSGTLSPSGGEGGGEGVRFMEREHLQDSDVSWGHEPPLGSAGVPPASSPGVPPGFRDFEFFPGGETPPEPAGGTPALRFMGSHSLAGAPGSDCATVQSHASIMQLLGQAV